MKILLLVLATAIWGAGFMGTRWTMDVYSPVWSHSLRFIFAGLFIFPFILFNLSKVNWRKAFILSVLLFIGLMLQTYGIKYTTLAKSGFITTFYALFTPVILGLYFKKKFTKGYWALVAVALVGMALLCELHWTGFNIGDAYTLLSALFFSLHIIAVDVYAKDEPPILINSVQCFIMGIIGLVYGLIAEGIPDLAYIIPGNIQFNELVFYGFIILSLFSSLIAFSIQMIAQKDIPPHVVSLVFLMESIFASILGYYAFGETLSTKALIGAFLILSSVASLKPLMDRKSLKVK